MQKAARRDAARAALVAQIDLATADRVASFLLGVEPEETPIDTSSASAIDRYTHGFLRRGGQRGWQDSDNHPLRPLDLPASPSEGPGGLWVVACHDYEDLYARSGDLRVWWPGGTHERAASIAHLVIEGRLSVSELEALIADPSWTPPRVEHPLPIAHPPPSPPLALCAPRTTDAVLVTIALVPSAALASFCAAMLLEGMWIAFCLGVLPSLFCYFAAVTLIDVGWHERRARRLAPDEHGVIDPRTGVRVAWDRMRRVDAVPRGFAITFPDGTVVRLPHALFADGHAAEAHVRSRIERGRASPYRAP